MSLRRNRVVLRTVLLWISCAFLLQGAWAAFSGSGFLAGDSLAEGSSRKFILVDSSVTNSSFASLSISSADPPNGDDPTLVYHHHDLLGSVVALSNKDAEAVEYVRYTSFGKATILKPDLSPTAKHTSNYSNRHLYTGREHLREVNLNDHRNRYYSPHLGRWTTTDPIQFQAGDINLYRYVGNGVTMGVDLWGLEEGVSVDLKVTIKSYISPIGFNYGFKALANIGNPILSLSFINFAHATDAMFSEDPVDPEERGTNYRLLSAFEISACCSNDGKISVNPQEPELEKDTGMELMFQAPPLNVNNLDFSMKNNESEFHFSWVGYGRPHNAVEPSFQAHGIRLNRNIWHQVAGVISCDDTLTPKITINRFRGSKFPSHRLWSTGNRLEELEQGSFSDLWFLEDVPN